MKKILILGGCGYVGSPLVERLLNKGHKVDVIDNQWFGVNLDKSRNLKIIKKDIRNITKKDFRGKAYDCLIHLANIANDPSVDLNPLLSWEVNVLAFKNIIELSIDNKIKKFIYASSGSVYGISKSKKVNENHDLIPISYYNKTKMIAERVLLSYQKKIKIYIARPGTICGISRRTRLDVVVNMFCYQAYKNKKIKIFGGSQIRPNIHIDDMINAYEFFLNKKIEPGVYNLGNENLSIHNIAKLVSKYSGCKIYKTKSNDNRSYRLDSSKIVSKGFKFTKSVDNAISEVLNSLKNKQILIKDEMFTVSWMSKNNYK